MERLRENIESGKWHAGSMIPTENELCREFDVSKITVREAIKILVQEGLLSRTPGKGTFVTQPKLEQKLNRFFSFTRWAQGEGLEPASRILKVETLPCDQHMATHLSMKPGEKVTKIERLRLGSGEPLMFETIWVSASLCPRLHLQDLANQPLNNIIAQKYNLPLLYATESIEAGIADEYVAGLLGISEGSPLLKVEHTAFTEQRTKVYFVTSFYRGDRVKFFVELTGAV
jgi:GntR family transcriptional regulator